MRILTEPRHHEGDPRRARLAHRGASPGDSLVFHYSGHGSQVPDRNGDETTDRLDEILCPYDLDWDRPLTDDDLAAACANVPQGALLTVILDCCHSGTGLRDFVRPCGVLPSDAPDRRRFLPHPDTPHPAPPLPRRRPPVRVRHRTTPCCRRLRDNHLVRPDRGGTTAPIRTISAALSARDPRLTTRPRLRDVTALSAPVRPVPPDRGPAPLLADPVVLPLHGRMELLSVYLASHRFLLTKHLMVCGNGRFREWVGES